MADRRLFPRFGLAVVLATALGILACNESEPTNPAGPEVFAAKGGSGGPPPKVNQADPSEAPQDTTLDVRVIGSGFDNGSVAKFLLAGQSTLKVVVNSSQFVDSKNLIANVTIALDADVALYDIAVTTTRGKKGIGSELFAVTEKGSKPEGDPSITVTFTDRAGDNIRSDGRGTYVDGECGVMATFNLQDARLDPDATKIHPKNAVACDGRVARSVKVSLTQPTEDSPPHNLDGTTQGGNFFKVNEVEDVIGTDGTVPRTAVIHGPFGCGLGLRFNPNLDSKSNSVEVTQNADGTWTVATRPAPNDVAVCLTNEAPRRYYHLPFEITVTLK